MRLTSTRGGSAAPAGNGGIVAAADRGGTSAASTRRLGSKANEATYKTIINQIPPHRIYIEPFLGWGAILLHKLPAAYNVAVDLDRDRVAEFDRAIVAADAPLLTVSESAVDVCKRATSLSADLPAPVARVAAEPPLQARVGGLEESQSKASSSLCSLVVGDALAFLSNFPWRGDEFVYCDPPYMPETRTSRNRYRYEMTPFDHARLLRVLLALPAAVMISGYHSSLYERLLSDWRLVTFEAVTRGGSIRTEHLWCNYPDPVELHDYRWLGKDHRERQDLNRMRRRWVSKLEGMAPIKRHALFAALREFTIAARGEAAAMRRPLAAELPSGSGKETLP